MKDGTDAVSDWPLLNALLNSAGGASWVSLHHGGGVGMGYSQHSGMVIVADGTRCRGRLERVLINDRGSGVMRHADAGYEAAVRCAREKVLHLPSLDFAQRPPRPACGERARVRGLAIGRGTSAQPLIPTFSPRAGRSGCEASRMDRQPLSAWSRSAMRSSGFSMPTERRIKRRRDP